MLNSGSQRFNRLNFTHCLLTAFSSIHPWWTRQVSGRGSGSFFNLNFALCGHRWAISFLELIIESFLLSISIFSVSQRLHLLCPGWYDGASFIISHSIFGVHWWFLFKSQYVLLSFVLVFLFSFLNVCVWLVSRCLKVVDVLPMYSFFFFVSS